MKRKTQQERKERIEELTKEILKEVEEWKENLTEEEEKLAEAQKAWSSLSNKLDKTHLPNRIRLDVGGTIFATSKSTLMMREDNFFGAMFSGRFELHPEEDGTYFIDRDPSVFQHVLNFMRGQPPKLETLKSHQIDHLLSDAEFYQLKDLIGYIEEFYAMDSLILERNKDLIVQLENWTGKKWKLQYRGSRDGFAAPKFHSLCDHKGATLFIAQDINGYIFGGYLSKSWSSIGSYIIDPQAFIFTLRNPHNIPPTKYSNNGINSAYDSPGYLPSFGGGHDIYTAANCNENAGSAFGFPTNYSDTTGKGKTTFTGSNNWRAKEVEVFIVDN